MAERGETLSDRELAVLDLLTGGLTNREIARELDISPNTVKVHLRNIFTKLDVSSRTEATTFALQRGLISMPSTAAPGIETDLEPEADKRADPLPDASQPAVVDTEIGAVTGTAPTPETPSSRWRGLSIVLFGVIALIAVAWVALRLLSGQDVAGGETGDEFVEAAIGETRWSISRPLPTGRANMALVSVGLNLYQIGGEVEAGVLNLVDVFETDSHRWRSAAAKPTAVSDISAAILFGEIYAPGGRLADGRPTSVVEVYSPANNAWRPVAPLPRPISGGLALSDGNQLYLFGGWDGESYLAESYAYDPGADTWTELPAMTQPRAFATGDVLSGRAYVVGGFDGQRELAACAYFDIGKQTWLDCPPLLLARTGAGAAAVSSNLLYVLGGDSSEPVPFGEVYDVNTNTWQQVVMPMVEEGVNWSNLGVTNVETKIYVLGGRQAGQIVADNLVYAPFVHQTFLPAVGVEN